MDSWEVALRFPLQSLERTIFEYGGRHKSIEENISWAGECNEEDGVTYVRASTYSRGSL